MKTYFKLILVTLLLIVSCKVTTSVTYHVYTVLSCSKIDTGVYYVVSRNIQTGKLLEFTSKTQWKQGEYFKE